MSIPRVDAPLGKPEPYIIPAYAGEAMSIPGTKSGIRIFASAKETDNQISVFALDGTTGDPVGFHYHNEAHDIFLCTKGFLKVWAGDQCRILHPGDFCSVPPKIIHSPQLVGPITETVGLVTPGDWVDFFRFIGEPYDGIIGDEFDNRNPLESLFPKFQIIKEKYDVVFQPQHVAAPLSEWTEADHVIPDGVQPYYLQSNRGPRHLLGGVLSRPFITTKQSNGLFSITSIESSSVHPKSVLSRGFTFSKVHQVYHVLDGMIGVGMNGSENMVRAGETVFIPAGTKISLTFKDRFVRFWSYSSGDGLETLICQAGGSFEGVAMPDKAKDVDMSQVVDIAKAINVEIDV